MQYEQRKVKVEIMRCRHNDVDDDESRKVKTVAETKTVGEQV